MDAKNELAILVNPIFLPKLAKSEPKVIDLLSTRIDTRPPPQTNPNILPIGGLGGISPTSRATQTPS